MWLPPSGWKWDETDQKGKEEEIFWGAGNVWYLDLGDHMGIYTCKISLNSTLLINAFYILYVCYIKNEISKAPNVSRKNAIIKKNNKISSLLFSSLA